MAELSVYVSRSVEGLSKSSFTLPVFNVSKAELDYVPLAHGTSVKLPVTRAQPLGLTVIFETDEVSAYQESARASLEVTRVLNSGSSKLIGGYLRVFDVSKSSQSFITPVDDNPVPENLLSKVSDVTLDLFVSYDSYFKFAARSADGFRAILDDKGRVIPSSNAGYEVEAAKVGQRVQRTVITNSEFQLTLNLNPTVVKSMAAFNF